MCIILYHPKGAKLPSKETLEQCWEKNKDGAGQMKVEDGWIRIWKGFMSFNDLWQAYRTECFTESDEFVLHFRLATAGGVAKGNCHPFPLSADRRLLKKLKFRQRDGVQSSIMHNGILGKGEGDLSDTMVYVRDKLSDANGNIKTALNEATLGNKFLVFSQNEVVKHGHWNTDEKTGIWYSNYGWKKWEPKSGYGYHATRDQDYEHSDWYSSWRAKNVRNEITCPVCVTTGKSFILFSGVSQITGETLCYTCGVRFKEPTGKVVGFNDIWWNSWCRRESRTEVSCIGCEYVDSAYCGVCYKVELGLYEIYGDKPNICVFCKHKDTVWCAKCEDKLVDSYVGGYKSEDDPEDDLYCCGCGCSVKDYVVKDIKGFRCTVCDGYVQVASKTKLEEESGWCPTCGENVCEILRINKDVYYLKCRADGCDTVFTHDGGYVGRMKHYPAVRTCNICNEELPASTSKAWCEKCRLMDWCPLCGSKVGEVYRKDGQDYVFKCPECETVFHEKGHIIVEDAEIVTCASCESSEGLTFNSCIDDYLCVKCNRYPDERGM